MSEIIRNYYLNTKLESNLIDDKVRLFSIHPDIQKEFEYWILNNEYVNDGIVVNGFSAEMISKKSIFVDGEAAFILLIKLRENPDVTKKMIENGFVMK